MLWGGEKSLNPSGAEVCFLDRPVRTDLFEVGKFIIKCDDEFVTVSLV
jgi:hypothetical protein